MSTPGFGLSSTPQSSLTLTNLVEQKLRAERVVKTGAGWFLTIAILSMVNSVLAMSGAGIRFILAWESPSLLTPLPTRRANLGLHSIW